MLQSVMAWLVAAQALVVWDALVAASIFIASVAFAFTLGRNSIIVSFVAVVLAGLVAHLFPDVGSLSFLASLSAEHFKILVFGVATIIFGLVFRRNRFFEPYIIPTGLERFVFAAVLAGLIIVIIGSFVDPETLSIYVRQLFVSPLARLAWLLAPVIMMAIFRGDNA
ncbi:MAG: hypothetical protein WAZ14_03925 [Patescibacteria group bacterium]